MLKEFDELTKEELETTRDKILKAITLVTVSVDVIYNRCRTEEGNGDIDNAAQLLNIALEYLKSADETIEPYF